LRTKAYARGATMGGETLTVIPETENIRPLRDHLVLEVRSEVLSRYIQVVAQVEGLEGIVLAIGPGDHPYHYDYREKHKRTKSWQISTDYLKTTVKVGDVVKLGDGEIVNNGFQRFWWGDRLCLICREADVCGVVDPEPLETRSTPERSQVHGREPARHTAR
jgi:hypothetical protein